MFHNLSAKITTKNAMGVRECEHFFFRFLAMSTKSRSEKKNNALHLNGFKMPFVQLKRFFLLLLLLFWCNFTVSSCNKQMQSKLWWKVDISSGKKCISTTRIKRKFLSTKKKWHTLWCFRFWYGFLWNCIGIEIGNATLLSKF